MTLIDRPTKRSIRAESVELCGGHDADLNKINLALCYGDGIAALCKRGTDSIQVSVCGLA
jgi:hypothetical protein